MKEYLSTADEVLRSQKTGHEGLSSAEASSRLEKNGKNKLAEAKKDSMLKKFFDELKEPMLIILMIGMFALMIIPQRKREKKIKDMLAAIKVGDRVRTIGGIYGTVSALRDDIVTLTVGPDKVRLVFARGAIANVENVPVEATMDDGVAETK